MNELNLAFAFTAGIFATVNPCGWAMLPSFVSYYLGSKDESYEHKPLLDRASEGIVLGLLLTGGFLTVFGTFGIVISAGLRAVVQWMPVASLIVGVGLVILGVWLYGGKSIPFPLPSLKVDLQSRTPKSIFLFGVAYGLASLSCTLPIFLAVIGAGLTVAGPLASGIMLASYGAGMATVLMGVSFGAVMFKGAVSRCFTMLLPYVHKFGAAMLILAGLYLIWYQGRYLPLIFSGF
ncbi:MAG TPA: cytochrome c biogenesis CcdA family protein [Anaerolineales bacterium]|nr:cytochrome c biogenesis CcdA family protein [Anaerolineales bacterium]HRQ93384.1 cytochrome c biogenesis CcdA family protein [Anaerolineales bacterium]